MYKSRVFLVVCAGVLGLAILPPHPAAAAWPTDPLVNVPLCTAAAGQTYPRSIPDGAGGAIVAWTDARGSTVDVYVQRVSADGEVLWTIDGVAVCTAPGGQGGGGVTITSDGAGGAIMAWADGRHNDSIDIFAQRISAEGTVLWAPDGVALTTPHHDNGGAVIVPDGAGGAIVVFNHSLGYVYDVYAQRVGADGSTP